MTTSAENNMLDWTLEDGKWKDSFDKLFENAPPLRELNLVKKNVRASYNFDSSIENSKDECFSKKTKRVKKKAISTPVGKLPKQPFTCTISPINTWRQDFFKSSKSKGKPKQRESGNLQSTVIYPAVVVTDYDSIKEISDTNNTQNENTLDILLTQPHKIGTLRRRRENCKKAIKEQHNDLENKRIGTKRTLKAVKELGNIDKKLPNETHDNGLKNTDNNKNITEKVSRKTKSYASRKLQTHREQLLEVTEDLPLECIRLQNSPENTFEAAGDLSHECVSKNASINQSDLMRQKRILQKHAVEKNSLLARKSSKICTNATRVSVEASKAQEITDEENFLTSQNILHQKRISRTAEVSLPPNMEGVLSSPTYEKSKSDQILTTETSNIALSTNNSTENVYKSNELTSDLVRKDFLEAKVNEEGSLTSLSTSRPTINTCQNKTRGNVHATVTYENYQNQQSQSSQAVRNSHVPNQVESTCHSTELSNKFGQTLQPIAAASSEENLKSARVSIAQTGNNDSISIIETSIILPRKTVKFKDPRRKIRISSKEQNDDSDIVLIETNNQSKKNNNDEQVLNMLENINGRIHSKSLNKNLHKNFEDPSLRPIKSYNDCLSKRNINPNNSLQPGKWRKSLNALRRSQLSQARQSSHRNVCQLETIIDNDESVEYVSSSTFIGTRKTILLKEQNFNASQKSFINIKDYKARVLEYCDQVSPLSFNSIYAKELMKDCQKIGEGVYGEVFIKKFHKEFVVCKIIPIEGTFMINGEVQKTFEQILPEIVISKELCRLNDKTRDAKHSTCGFVDIKKVACVEGKYPEHLVKCWEMYDDEKTSENDHPGVFDDKQLYIVLELEFAGKDLETFKFYDAEQSFAALQQIVITIAVAEEALQFEHRDLHWGNVLIRSTDDTEFQYKISGETFTVPTKGIKATIIDYTLSRIKYEHHCFYNDLAKDEELFTATGDYQFDIYRKMRDVLGFNWERFEPRTNVFWISYIISKMQNGVKYKSTRTKVHTQYLRKMRALKKDILEFTSASTFAKHLLNIS